MSETALARPLIQQFLSECPILDVGFGGTSVHPDALTMDMPVGYCPSLEGHRQFFKGDCRDLSFLCDGVIGTVFSSHLLEDFYFSDMEKILVEFRRVLRIGGSLITVCPDQQVYAAHCARTGQTYNKAHKESSMSLSTFSEVVKRTGSWETLMEIPIINTYSFVSVLKKIA